MRVVFRVTFSICGTMSLLASGLGAESLSWSRLPSLPDVEGFAGPFGGVYRGALVVAGGANFPGKKPWEGGAKKWHDTVFVLDAPTAQWRIAGRLPRPLGYGVAVTTTDGIVCAGGSDAKRHYAEVFLLRLTNGVPQFTQLAPLPRPSANGCGALLGDTLYVAGGTDNPGATRAMRTFWSLELSRPGAKWRELEPCPGPARLLATAGVAHNSFFIFGGAALEKGAEGKAVRRWLRDAWQFTPGRGWRRLPDLPRVAVAAPSPAPLIENRLPVLGGDDGSQVNAAPSEHRGFRRDVLAFDTMAESWKPMAEIPFSLVTTPVIEWNGHIVIPGGEMKPGFRSTEVWSTTPGQP
jgi:N-acetylneuraminic acid mutarotase